MPGETGCSCCRRIVAALPPVQNPLAHLLPALPACPALPLLQVEGDLDRNAFETSKPNELLMKLRRTEPYYQVGKGGRLGQGQRACVQVARQGPQAAVFCARPRLCTWALLLALLCCWRTPPCADAGLNPPSPPPLLPPACTYRCLPACSATAPRSAASSSRARATAAPSAPSATRCPPLVS